MEGMQFTRNRQDVHSFGTCLAGNPMRLPAPVTAGFRIVVLRSPPIQFPDLKHVGVFFSKLNLRVFCYS